MPIYEQTSGTLSHTHQSCNRMTETWLRYVPHDRVIDYFRLGWMWTADLGSPHGNYCALLEWPCTCKMVEPVRLDP